MTMAGLFGPDLTRDFDRGASCATRGAGATADTFAQNSRMCRSMNTKTITFIISGAIQLRCAPISVSQLGRNAVPLRKSVENKAKTAATKPTKNMYRHILRKYPFRAATTMLLCSDEDFAATVDHK